MTFLLDCNIWVTLAINSDLSLIENLVQKGHNLVTCDNLIFELTDVLSRPKFNKYFIGNYLDSFIRYHQTVAKHFHLGQIERVVADKKDDYLFALCKVSNADYMVTGDKLLLNQEKFGIAKMVTLYELRQIVSL